MNRILLKIDLSQVGMSMIFKPYEEKAIRYLWSLEGEGASCKEVWDAVTNMDVGRRARHIFILTSTRAHFT